mmetsp:Transcript_7747/g.10154  ORF Transcript_7747/g.10154 Transcript_7747/m.10154 type:complete len:140 (-) Transcript_7747:206-625(-)
MEDIQHLSKRVSLAGAIGAISGSTIALLRGHPVARTAGLTAFSCGMVGSVCFGTERLTNALVSDMMEGYMSRRNKLLLTHGTAGCAGGSMLGMLYQGRSLNGIALFLPLMLLAGLGESRFQDSRDERIRKKLEQTSKEL